MIDPMDQGILEAFHPHAAFNARALGHLDADTVAPSTCTMKVRFDLSRFDDPKLDVRAGGSKGHVNRT